MNFGCGMSGKFCLWEEYNNLNNIYLGKYFIYSFYTYNPTIYIAFK